MPFLSKVIYVELLKTYPGGKVIEEKYESLIKTSKESSVLDRFWSATDVIKNMSLGWAGFNTSSNSESVYLELRALLDDTTRRNDPEGWVNIITKAGDGGYSTYINSFKKSDLSRVAFALLMDIRNQVDGKIQLIENKIKFVEDKSSSSNSKQLSLEEKMRLYRDKIYLDADEELAFKIHLALKQRIVKCKRSIQLAQELMELPKELGFYTTYAGKFKINHDTGENLNLYLTKEIEIAQRHLLYLGDESINNDPTLTKSATDLFGSFAFYCDQLRKSYKLTDKQINSINVNLHLPIVLQRLYPSLYIREHYSDIRHIVDEDTVMACFHQFVMNMTKPPSSQNIRVPIDVTEYKDTRTPAATPGLAVDTAHLCPTPPPITVEPIEIPVAMPASPVNPEDEQVPVEPGSVSSLSDNEESGLSTSLSTSASSAGFFKSKDSNSPLLETTPPSPAASPSAETF